jgi:hypothetical protein
MSKPERSTCVGRDVEKLLEATERLLAVCPECDVLLIWRRFARRARAELDAAEDYHRSLNNHIDDLEHDRDEAEGNVYRLERELQRRGDDRDQAEAFLDRIFAGDMTGEDWHRCVTKGWPVELLDRRRVSA